MIRVVPPRLSFTRPRRTIWPSSVGGWLVHYLERFSVLVMGRCERGTGLPMGLAVVRSLDAPRRLETTQDREDYEQELVDQFLLARAGTTARFLRTGR